jgi:hypothetical protein
VQEFLFTRVVHPLLALWTPASMDFPMLMEAQLHMGHLSSHFQNISDGAVFPIPLLDGYVGQISEVRSTV